MIKKLKILYIFLLLAVSSCGYQMMYEIKDIKFLIGDINLNGNDQVNNQINNRLKHYKENKNYSKIIDMSINSSTNKEISSKDRKGNAKTYKLTLNIKVEIFENNKLIKTKNYSKASTYNNLNNKFDLNQYEKNLMKNLTNDVVEDIEILLNSVNFVKRKINNEIELTLTS